MGRLRYVGWSRVARDGKFPRVSARAAQAKVKARAPRRRVLAVFFSRKYTRAMDNWTLALIIGAVIAIIIAVVITIAVMSSASEMSEEDAIRMIMAASKLQQQ
jgi:hypothetical protein